MGVGISRIVTGASDWILRKTNRAHRVEVLANGVIREMDEMVVDIDDVTPAAMEKEVTSYGRQTFLTALVHFAREEFGRPTDTPANRQMVRTFLRDHMRLRKMRPMHIAKHLNVATSLVFVPTNADIEEELIMNSAAVARQHSELAKAKGKWSILFRMRYSWFTPWGGDQSIAA
jgi:hypothetical protein